MLYLFFQFAYNAKYFVELSTYADISPKLPCADKLNLIQVFAGDIFVPNFYVFYPQSFSWQLTLYCGALKTCLYLHNNSLANKGFYILEDWDANKTREISMWLESNLVCTKDRFKDYLRKRFNHWHLLIDKSWEHKVAWREWFPTG